MVNYVNHKKYLHMIHLIVQPKIDYYTWQVEVVINSILEHFPNNTIHIICNKSTDHIIENKWNILEIRYPSVNFFYYDDTRMNPGYISSIRPHLLEKHFLSNPTLSSETFFYHDSDVVFTKPLIYKEDSVDDWYVSDTISYIGHDYILSKGEDVLDLMCNICDIDKSVVKLNQANSGGAQYIMKNINAEYWHDVYLDCENLFVEITKMNNTKKQMDPSYHELQIWCADMWAVLWNAWKLGYNTNCIPEMNFNWSTTPKSEWDILSIYHNAGVTNNLDMFYKNNYTTTLPYNLDLHNLNESVCAYNYYNYVQEIGHKSFLHDTISIVVVCTNSYSALGIRFINNFMRYYKGTKKIIFNIFTDIIISDYLNDYDSNKYLLDVTHFENSNWEDGTNSKFTNILSIDAYGEYIFYFDADTNILLDFDESWFIGNLVGGEHFINKDSLVKNYDRNPLSRSYIAPDTTLPQTYYYGAFFGGRSDKVLAMCKTLYDNQISDKIIHYEPTVNDESYINNYFHFNSPRIIKCEDFQFAVSDKGGISDTRHIHNVNSILDEIKLVRFKHWGLINGKVRCN